MKYEKISNNIKEIILYDISDMNNLKYQTYKKDFLKLPDVYDSISNKNISLFISKNKKIIISSKCKIIISELIDKFI